MKILEKYKAEDLWLRGLVFWPIHFVGLMLIVFGSSVSLDFKFQSIIVVYNSLMIGYVFLLIKKMLKENTFNHLLWLKNGYNILITMGVIYFIFQNSIPYVIDDTTFNGSPFSEWFDGINQTNFGYPFAFFRNLKTDTVLFGKYIFDVAALSFNIVYFLSYTYCLVGLNLLIQYLRLGSHKV